MKEILDFLKYGYQNNLESIESSEFASVMLIFCIIKCHKVNPNRGGSHIDSPD